MFGVNLNEDNILFSLIYWVFKIHSISHLGKAALLLKSSTDFKMFNGSEVTRFPIILLWYPL